MTNQLRHSKTDMIKCNAKVCFTLEMTSAELCETSVRKYSYTGLHSDKIRVNSETSDAEKESQSCDSIDLIHMMKRVSVRDMH